MPQRGREGDPQLPGGLILSFRAVAREREGGGQRWGGGGGGGRGLRLGHAHGRGSLVCPQACSCLGPKLK